MSEENNISPKDVPVFVLCGGLGTRLKEETEFRPKPMVPIGDKPILQHIIQIYRGYGFKKFVLCLGFKSEVIKSYFLNYSTIQSDFSIDLKSNTKTIHSVNNDLDYDVTLAYTGELTMTGARIKKAVSKYLGDAKHFAVTYGDGLTDANLAEELKFHLAHNKIGTVLGVNPPTRFGELQIEGDKVMRFEEKPEFTNKFINGGYFFFRNSFADYITTEEDCILERAPLVKLAKDGELNVFQHTGFWECMDTQRDKENLEKILAGGNAPWIKNN